MYKKKINQADTNIEAVKPGDVVVIRGENDKTKNRETYLVTKVEDKLATCIKTSSRSKGTPYKVKLEDLFIIVESNKVSTQENSESLTSDSENDELFTNTNEAAREEDEAPMEGQQNDDEEPDENAIDNDVPAVADDISLRKSKRVRAKIDYNVYNETGEKIVLQIVRNHCQFCKKCCYRYFQHNPETCRRAQDARLLMKKNISNECDDTDDSCENDTEDMNAIDKIKLLNKIALEVMKQTRDILSNGVMLTEFSISGVNSKESSTSTLIPLIPEEYIEEGSETQSLNWEDFENSHSEVDLVDTEHLISFAENYDGDHSDSGSSIFSRSDDDVIDYDSSTIKTAVQCAELAASRKRSVSVSENFLEMTEVQDSDVATVENEDDDKIEDEAEPIFR